MAIERCSGSRTQLKNIAGRHSKEDLDIDRPSRSKKTWTIPAMIRGAVGLLAASQGLRPARARPPASVNGVLGPPSYGGSTQQRDGSPRLYPDDPGAGIWLRDGDKIGPQRTLLLGGGKTHVTNNCKYSLIVSMDYVHFNDFFDHPLTHSIVAGKGVQSLFVDRVIRPGAQDFDKYSYELHILGVPDPQVQLWFETGTQAEFAGVSCTIPSDISVSAETSNDPNKPGCDVYKLKHGLPDHDGGPVLFVPLIG